MTDAPANSNDKVDLGVSGDVEVARRPCSTLQSDLILLLVEILLHIGLRALEDDLSLGLSSLKFGVLDMGSTECFKNRGRNEVESKVSVPKDGIFERRHRQINPTSHSIEKIVCIIQTKSPNYSPCGQL